MAALRKKLEDLRELRELVRQLGRGGGKGPLKKAPEQVWAGQEGTVCRWLGWSTGGLQVVGLVGCAGPAAALALIG